MTKFKSQALHIIRIKYWNACGSGNPYSLIPTLWNIGILLHKQATRTKHFDGECTSLISNKGCVNSQIKHCGKYQIFLTTHNFRSPWNFPNDFEFSEGAQLATTVETIRISTERTIAQQGYSASIHYGCNFQILSKIDGSIFHLTTFKESEIWFNIWKLKVYLVGNGKKIVLYDWTIYLSMYVFECDFYKFISQKCLILFGRNLEFTVKPAMV